MNYFTGPLQPENEALRVSIKQSWERFFVQTTTVSVQSFLTGTWVESMMSAEYEAVRVSIKCVSVTSLFFKLYSISMIGFPLLWIVAEHVNVSKLTYDSLCARLTLNYTEGCLQWKYFVGTLLSNSRCIISTFGNFPPHLLHSNTENNPKIFI
jgi:hypothetical protein